MRPPNANADADASIGRCARRSRSPLSGLVWRSERRSPIGAGKPAQPQRQALSVACGGSGFPGLSGRERESALGRRAPAYALNRGRPGRGRSLVIAYVENVPLGTRGKGPRYRGPWVEPPLKGLPR